MATGWNVVRDEHVRQACNRYDAKEAVPRSPARNTLLVVGENRYPAKFIRGLAYRLATGREPGDYNGGMQTVAFFNALGFTCEHDGRLVRPTARAAPITAVTFAATARAAAPAETATCAAGSSTPGGKVTQKQALLALLMRRFGTVEREASFDWLTVPSASEMRGTVGGVHGALVRHRGHDGFATAGKRLHCDYYVPARKLLIEYDERQHFTVPRALGLRSYPADLALHYDRQAWIDACEQIRANDPTPPYRDEQRAFYDALRDIRSAENGHTLVRLRDGTFDWSSDLAARHLDEILDRCRSVRSPRSTSRGARTEEPAGNRIGTLALVSHDYTKRDGAGLWDYSAHFGRINRLCDEAGCDTILYALYTWDARSPVSKPSSSAALFDGLRTVRRIVIEVGDLSANGGNPGLEDLRVEVWDRGRDQPVIVRQRFATSQGAWAGGEQFVTGLPQRMAADGLVMVCGETNATSLERATKRMYDPHRVNDRLAEMGVSVVLNPIHDYMRRYEMKEKRRYYSAGGRWVASVWNRGRGREAHAPWTLFHDGLDVTQNVVELPTPFADRTDIRIGVVTLT